VIATADSALGQVSSLLNDIRGLVTESANAGALSDAQIDANQLQLDSSLEALNRMLDGSLDFLTTAGTNFSDVSNLQIDQANLGATGSVSVDISVSTAATQALVQVASVPAGVPAVTASAGELDFQTAAVTEVLSNTATDGTSITLANASSGAAVIDVTAITGQDLAGAAGDITIAFADTATAGAETATLVGTTLTIGIESDTTTITQVLAAINGYDGGGTAGADLAAVLTSGTTGDAFAAADNG